MQTATAMDVTPATVNQTGEVLLTMSAEAPALTVIGDVSPGTVARRGSSRCDG